MMIFKTRRKFIALLSVYASFLVVMMACGNSALTGLTTGTTGTTTGTTTTTTTASAVTLTGGSPSGVLAVGTTQATLSLTTNVNATCKYATSSGVTYASMPNTFTTTGSTAQSTAVTGLANGTTYNYYVKCQDTSGNTSSDFPISFMVASLTGGNSYYVDIVNGSDSNSGSITSPWKYLDTSVHKLKPGDTLFVRKGTYPVSPGNSQGGVFIGYGANYQLEDGAPGYTKTVQAYPGETPIVSEQVQLFSNYWTLKGLTFTNSMLIRPYPSWTSLGIPAGNTAPMGHEVTPNPWPHDIQIVNNTFAGTVSYAAIETAASNLLIANNDFTQVRSTTNSSLYQNIYVTAGDNLVIRGNKISGQAAYGIQLYDERRATGEVFTRWITNAVIENNIVYGGTYTAGDNTTLSPRGIEIGTGSYTKGNNIIVRNNIVYNTAVCSIQLDQGFDNVKIFNNTVFQPASGSTAFNTRSFGSGVSTNVFVENNIFDLGANSATTSSVSASSVYPITLSNNLYYPATPKVSGATELTPVLGDPKFVNATTDPTLADFHLQSAAAGSAAVDRGLTLTEVPTDRDGTARPQGPAYDIGAYEFH